MRSIYFLIPFLALMSGMCTCGVKKESSELSISNPGHKIEMEPGRTLNSNRVAGQFIFQMQANTPETQARDLLIKIYSAQGVQSVKVISPDYFLVVMQKDLAPEKVKSMANEHALIKHAQPNFVYNTNSGF